MTGAISKSAISAIEIAADQLGGDRETVGQLAGEIALLTQLPLASILRHYVHILSVAVTVCNIPFHFGALGLEFKLQKSR